MIQSYKDLDVYNLSYELAMEVFELSKSFPKEEQYSLTSQLIRSSRSVSANISEGWAKRNYENYFKQQLIHAIGSTAETENWICFARDCNYVTETECEALLEKLDHIGRILTKLHKNWKSFQ